jgi:hypothetical protein
MKRFNSSGSNGNGFAGSLFLLFLGLRLAGFIQWPWVWVFAPIWITLTLAAVYVIVKRLLRK